MAQDDRRVASDLRRSPHVAVVDEDSIPDDGFRAPIADDEPPIAPQTQRRRRGRGALREVVETLLLALVIFVAVRLVVLNFRVDGLSMSPNLANAEMLLVNRNVYFHFDANRWRNLLPGDDREGEDIVYLFHAPERGDIIVFEPPVGGPSKPYIKRVIGVPGDRVTFANGDVYVDGELLPEDYIDDGITDCSGSANKNCDLGEIPDGMVFVLGDNRDNSSDSRSFGLVDVDAIIGKAWITYWPTDDIGFVPHEDYPGIPESATSGTGAASLVGPREPV